MEKMNGRNCDDIGRQSDSEDRSVQSDTELLFGFLYPS
jgi:hypothetical protein